MFARTNTGDNLVSRLTRCDVPPASIETTKTLGRMILPPICCRGPLPLQLRRRRRRRHRHRHRHRQRPVMHKPTIHLPLMVLTSRLLLLETQGLSLCPPPLLASRRRRKWHRRSKEQCTVSSSKREGEVDRRRARRRSRRL